jgi:hypothetical protein
MGEYGDWRSGLVAAPGWASMASTYANGRAQGGLGGWANRGESCAAWAMARRGRERGGFSGEQSRGGRPH